jgi:hypothetical protein
VTQGATVTVSTTLDIQQGTFVTNGCTFTSSGTVTSTVTFNGKLDITIGGTVSLAAISQYSPGLRYMSISGAPTVNISGLHDIGYDRRCDISGGTVNYTAVGNNLQVRYVSGGWGWFATAGTISFTGSIVSNPTAYFQASGTAVVRFVGATNTTVNMQTSDSASAWYFNDLRIEKTGGASVTMQTTGGTLSVSATAAIGITVNAGAALTLGGTFSAGNGWDVNAFTNSGSVTHSAINMFVSANWTNNGTFTPGTNTVVFDGASAQTIGGTANTTFYGLTLSTAQTRTIADGRTVTVNGVLTWTAGNFTVGATAAATLTCAGTVSIPATCALTATSTSAINVGGDWTNGGTFNYNTGTVTFNGAAAQVIAGNTSFYYVRFTGAGTKSVAAGTTLAPTAPATFPNIPMTVASGSTLSLPNAGGVFNINSSYGFQISGTLTVAGGTFNCQASNGDGSTNNDSWLAASILNVSAGTFAGSGDANFTGATLNISGGNVNIDGSILGSGTLNQSNGTIRNSASGAQFNLSGGSLTGGTMDVYQSSTPAGLTVTGATTATGSHTTNIRGATVSGSNPDVAAAVAAQLGSVTCYSNCTLVLGAGASLAVQGNFTIDTGITFSANGYSFSVGGGWTNNGTFTPGANTVIFNGGAGQTIGGTADTAFNNLTLSTAQTRTIADGRTVTVNGALTWTAGNFTVGSTAAATLTLSGGVTIPATYTLTTTSTAAINVPGNWTNNGTYTCNTGTVTLNGAAGQTIGGTANTTFCNLTLSTAQTRTIADGRTVAVTGTLNWTAVANNNLTVGATAAATFTVAGGITIPASCTLTATSNATINVGGNWTNNGTFTPNTGAVNFNGSATEASPQQITGAVRTDFYRIDITSTAVQPLLNTGYSLEVNLIGTGTVLYIPGTTGTPYLEDTTP